MGMRRRASAARKLDGVSDGSCGSGPRSIGSGVFAAWMSSVDSARESSRTTRVSFANSNTARAKRGNGSDLEPMIQSPFIRK